MRVGKSFFLEFYPSVLCRLWHVFLHHNKNKIIRAHDERDKTHTGVVKMFSIRTNKSSK